MITAIIFKNMYILKIRENVFKESTKLFEYLDVRAKVRKDDRASSKLKLILIHAFEEVKNKV